MRRVNLIPLAGAGQRFVDAGYKIPKPLVPIAGVPMIVRAARCLPEADQWVFVCRAEHVRETHLDARLTTDFPGARIVTLAGSTEGQACTCLAAAELLRPDDALTIGACDNSMTYDAERFRGEMANPSVDALVWTFRHNPAVMQHPRMYGWVQVTPKGGVDRISCKFPISSEPMNDHAVIGAFSFKRAEAFADCAKSMIAQNRRVNNEFYVDELLNVAIESGLRIKVFEVDRYICWGTPRDVDVFHYWWSYFSQNGLR